MPNYLPFQGAENVSVPNDLNSEMPVQRFAFGGIANPSQQPFLSKADREYLEGKQADLERLATYDRAVEAYNRDVYTPYEKAYGEYEKSINAWNEGPRTEDYAGPAAPELAPFTVAKPEVSFDPQAVVEFQKAAARRAQEAAAQRGLAIDVVSDPSKYNLGSLSVSNAFMAKGGEVKAKDMLKRVAKAGRNGDTELAYLSPSARDMLKSMGGAGTINPKTELPEYFASVLRPISNQVAAVIAASNLPPPAATSAAATPASATPPSAAAATSTTPRSPVSPLVETPGIGTVGQKGLSGSPIPTGVSPVPTFNFGSLIRGATTPSQPTRQAPTVAPLAATQPAPDSRREDLIWRGPALIKPISSVGGRESEYAPIKSPDGQKFYSGGQWWDNSPVSNQPLPPVNSSPNMGAPIFLPQPNQSPPSDFVGPPLPPKQSQPPVAQPPTGTNPNQALAERVLQMAVKKITPDLQYDTNGDGRITSADALAVSKGWKPSTPPLSGPGTDYPPLPPDFVGPRLPGQETPRQPTVPSPILPPAPAPAPTPTPPKPVARGMPGTRPYIPVMTYQGPTAVDLLQQNPSLAPQPLGGQGNMGYMTDRLGNIIRSPMMPRPVFAFARGGDVSTDALLQRVNEYNLYGDDPEYYSESRNMLQEMPGMSETRYSETPSTKTVKKITKRPLEAKSSEGFGKGMAMEVESLTTSKGTSPKALKGTAKDDFMELARTYKLKAREAESMARGLSRDTFNAPTLEKPSLTKGSLTKRRFEEGGEVKKFEGESLQSPEEQPVVEESSASRALKQLVAPVREGIKGYFGMESEAAGDEAYRTGQALSNMPGVGAPAALGIFIGRGAKGWNKVMNDVAKKMTKQGATPEEVWQTTRNFKGPDGMWRQEISDQAARINPSVSQGPLSMYLKHPELYENYPDLRQVLVRTDPDVRTSSYSPAADDILIKSRDPDKAVSSALHEVSHAVQTREGFAPGGSSLMAFKDPQAFDVLKEVRASMSTPTSKEVYRINAGWSPEDVGTKAFEDAYKQYVKYIKDQSKTPEFDRLVQERAANVYYERLLGEAEARAVESRRLWTPEQRLQGIPSQSYERIGEPGGVIPLEKLIIKKAKGGPVDTSTAKGQLAKLKAA